MQTLLAEEDLDTETGTAYALDWTVDGETLAVAAGIDITVLGSSLSDVIATLKPSTGAICAAWSPDHRQLATVSGARSPMFTIWDRDSANAALTMAQQIPAPSDQYGVSWCPDGKLLARLANDRARIWDTSTWALLRTLELPYANPRRVLSWSATSRELYDAGELNGQAIYFGVTVADGSVQELDNLPVAQTYALAFSPDFTQIAAASQTGAMQIIEIVSSITS